MSDDRTTTNDEHSEGRIAPAQVAAPAHLRAVRVPAPLEIAAADRPRTIGRLIAQTALIADSAVARSHVRADDPADPRGPRGPRGRFRLR